MSLATSQHETKATRNYSHISWPSLDISIHAARLITLQQLLSHCIAECLITLLVANSAVRRKTPFGRQLCELLSELFG